MSDDYTPDPDVDAPPRRYKTPDELTVAEHRTHLATGELPERPRYTAYRAEVLKRAGLDEEPQDKSPADMSVEDHMADIRRRRR